MTANNNSILIRAARVIDPAAKRDETADVPLPPGRYQTQTEAVVDSQGAYRISPKATTCFCQTTCSLPIQARAEHHSSS